MDSVVPITKNQYLLFSIYDFLVNDLKYKVTELELIENELYVEVNHTYKILISIICCNTIVLKINNLKKIDEEINDNTFSNIMNKLLEELPISDNVDLDEQNFIFNKFIKLSSLFMLSYRMIQDLTIENKYNKNSLSVIYKEEHVYTIKLHYNNKVIDYDFEYNNDANKLCKFYDKDKSYQIITYISKILIS